VSLPTTVPVAAPAPAPHAAAEEAARLALPGGYFDGGGAAHTEVLLAPLTGEDEFHAAAGASACRAEVATRLLSRCVRSPGTHTPVGRAFVSELAVGQRDFLLLKLRELSFGPRVDCVLRCPDEGCGKPMDLSLDTRELDIPGHGAAGRYFTAPLDEGAPDSPTVEFRLPNGADQEALAGLFARSPERAVDALLARCLRRVGERAGVDEAEVARLSPAAREQIDALMSRLAPPVECEIEARCVECGTQFETDFDVVGHFLRELAAGFRSLEREVHFLAWHYHWSERDILSMARGRRRRYVALVQEEVDRLNGVW